MAPHKTTNYWAVTAEFGHLHFYRTTLEMAEFLVFNFDESDGGFTEQDQLQVWRELPTRQIKQYWYQNKLWKDQEKIDTPDYDLIPHFVHIPGLNKQLGSTLDLDGYQSCSEDT